MENFDFILENINIMKSVKTVKNLLFKVKMDGIGTVNFDGSDARWNVSRYGNPAIYNLYGGKNNNIKVAKSEYRQVGTDENGAPLYKRTLKISSECLRHAIFERDYDVINGRIMRNDAFLSSFISSPAALLRGYMFADDKETIKAKSPVTIGAAIETSGAVITPEVGSVSGDKGDTSLFYTENTGRTKYETKGFVNLKQLEFLSCDNFFERRAVKSPWVETENGMLNTAFRQRYGKVPYSLGIYTATANAFTKHIGERGLHFSIDFRKYLIVEFFKRLLSVNITRSGSFAKVSEISVKPVYDGLKDTFENNDGWVGLSSEAEIEKFVESLDIYDFYEECDNDAKAVMDELRILEEKRKEEKDKKNNNKKKSESKTEEANNEDGSYTL